MNTNPDRDSDTQTTSTTAQASSERPVALWRSDPEEFERQQEIVRRQRATLRFANEIGRRYHHCKIANFEVPHEGMAEVKAKIIEYAKNMPHEIAEGNGIVLYGPTGTGKDHLQIAIGFAAIHQHGYSVHWKHGPDLVCDIKDCFGDRATRTEGQVIASMVQPTILILSDLVPAKGELSTFEANVLFRVIHQRNRNAKVTWVSMNVKDGKEADRRMGAAIVDRLKHDALTCFCNWPSYRASKGG